MIVFPEFVFEIFAVICIIRFLPLRDLSAVVVDDVWAKKTLDIH